MDVLFMLLLFILFMASYVIYNIISELYSEYVGSVFRKGETEIPTEISAVLHDELKNKAYYSGNNCITIELYGYGYKAIVDGMKVCDFIKEKIRYSYSSLYDDKWVDYYNVFSIDIDHVKKCVKAEVNLPIKVALSPLYIEHEINKIGIVYTSNSYNSTRYTSGGKKLNHKAFYISNGKAYVKIMRENTILESASSKTIKMSKYQITRNINNRLWGYASISNIRTDKDFYYAEIDFYSDF